VFVATNPNPNPNPAEGLTLTLTLWKPPQASQAISQVNYQPIRSVKKKRGSRERADMLLPKIGVTVKLGKNQK